MRLPSLLHRQVMGVYDVSGGQQSQRLPDANRPSLRLLPRFGAKTPVDTFTQEQVPIRWLDRLPEETLHLERLSRVVKHAQAAKQVYGNLSHRHYGAMVVFNNGIESLGTNVEASRQTVFCDLRYAITQGMNQSISTAVQRGEPHQLPTPTVKTIYLVNADLDGDPPIPCSDCQEWMNSRFCAPDTQVVSLEKDPLGTGAVVRSRSVGEMLPLHQGRLPVRMVTDRPLSALPLATSMAARQVLQREGLSQAKLRHMAEKARQAHAKNADGAMDSGYQTGVCSLLSPLGLLVAGGRFDWSTRWHESADLHTVANAFSRMEVVQNLIRPLAKASWMPGFISRRLSPWLARPTIQAVCYYGDDPELPPLASLGRIARRRGSSDTLVVTVENDTLQVRTIADFMPEMYRTR